jgi:hypothetical protein
MTSVLPMNFTTASRGHGPATACKAAITLHIASPRSLRHGMNAAP